VAGGAAASFVRTLARSRCGAALQQLPGCALSCSDSDPSAAVSTRGRIVVTEGRLQSGAVAKRRGLECRRRAIGERVFGGWKVRKKTGERRWKSEWQCGVRRI
jgi:hypothetical protein